MLTEEEIKKIISQTYAEIALQDSSDMRLVADLFEAIRPQLYAADPSDAWDYLLMSGTKTDSLAFNLFTADEQDKNATPAGNKQPDVEDVVLPLIMLREAYFKAFIKKQLFFLDDSISKRPAETVSLWNQYYADAAVHFREDFICMLCLHRSRWDADAGPIKYYAALADLMRESRWADARPYYETIAGDTHIDLKIRTQATVVLAEIIIYNYPQPKSAEQYLIQADKLMPDYFITKRARAQLSLKSNDYQKAKNDLLRVVYNQPADYLALVYAGDCFAGENNPEDAELWYTDALQKNYLQTESYKRLINLYANKTWFAQKKNRIYELIRRIEKRRWFRNMDDLIKEGIATTGCFKNVELYHAYRDAGAAWFSNDDFSKAEAWYQKALSLEPSLSAALIDLAYLKIRTGEPDKAKEYFDKALALNKDNFEVHWGLAYYYEQTTQKEEALASYTECLRLRPNWSDWIHNFIGNLYYSYKEYETAASYFRTAIAINSDPVVYKQNLANALGLAAEECAAQNTDAGKAKAEEYLRSAADTSNEAEAWNKLGNFYFSQEKWQESIDNFTKALALDDKEPVYCGNIALAYEKLNDAANTETWYRKAIEADDKSGRYYNRLGLFYFKREEYNNAIPQYEHALQREPDEADYLDNICIAYEVTGQADKAEPYYLKLLEKEPDNHKVMNMLAVMYYQRGDYEMALSYYKKAIEKNNTEEVYHENVALLYRSEGKLQEAIDALQAALVLNPRNDTNWNNAGVMYFNLGDNDKAIECYNKAIEISKEKPLYYENLGLACEKKAAFDAAIEAYQKGLNLHTSDGRFLNAIGLVYHRNGDFENAILYFQKAAGKEENNWLYYTNLGLAFSKSGKTDEALAAYQKALQLNETDYLNWNELGLLFREKNEYGKAIEAYRKAIEIEQNDTGVYYNLAVAEFINGNEQEAIKVISDGNLTDDLKDELQRFFQASKSQPEIAPSGSLK